MGDCCVPFFGTPGQLHGPQVSSSSYPHSATAAILNSSFSLCCVFGDERIVEKVETNVSKIVVVAVSAAVVKNN
uniref:Uncharacterized protein n=1 Tax=Panagrolaimus sp. ES5 TaxID=591445 RepID=A0AC34F792_9BILA